MRKRRKYIKKYYTYQVLGIVLSVIAGNQWLAILTTYFFATLYNTMCGGQSCDGSTFESCSASSEPELFLFFYLWVFECIIMTAGAIWSFVQMSNNKIEDSEGDS